MTTKQQTLQKKHGTPDEFAKAVMQALGEISLSEALNAISIYKREWEIAGREDEPQPR